VAAEGVPVCRPVADGPPVFVSASIEVMELEELERALAAASASVAQTAERFALLLVPGAPLVLACLRRVGLLSPSGSTRSFRPLLGRQRVPVPLRVPAARLSAYWACLAPRHWASMEASRTEIDLVAWLLARNRCASVRDAGTTERIASRLQRGLERTRR